MSQVLSRRGSRWLIGLVAIALLPCIQLSLSAPAAFADPPVFDGKEIKSLCTISSSGQSCPAFPAPPSLINEGALAATTPDIAASLRRLSDQAVTQTLADHQLPESDREAVQSFGRDDAEGELWALIVKALDTPADQRTTDQQNAADWMSQLASAQANSSAEQAGAEYATWAGLDVNHYWDIAGTASNADLASFLSTDVRPFSPNFTPRGGYCRYTPPDPYSTDYDGSETPTCFGPCPSQLGCVVPTPSFDDFEKWGDAAATYPTVTSTSFTQQAAAIAAGTAFGATVSAAGVAAWSGLAVTLTSALADSAVAAAVWPWADVAATAAGVGASAIAVVTIVILAVVIAVMESIRIANDALLPGKIADLVTNARTTVSDPSAMIGTTDGATTLYDAFVGTTMPRPRVDAACDNSLIPPWAYTSSVDPNLLIYVPLGSNDAITSPADRSGCLNPPPIPVSSPDDPHFLVGQGSGPSTRSSPTITTAVPSSADSQTVRLSGTWFVTERGGVSNADVSQSLRLRYEDWDGNDETAWLMRDTDGSYRFVGYQAGSTTIDPATCTADGTCWSSDRIEYQDPSGQDFTASVAGPVTSVGAPTYSPDPVEGSPVTFDPGGFAPSGSTGPIRYSWRFEDLGCGWLECVNTTTLGPAYSAPVRATNPTFTWQSIGPAKVELTATDSSGASVQTTFVVDVGNVDPTVTLPGHTWSGDVGDPITVTGSFGDAGTRDDENVVVSYGDGTQTHSKVGENSVTVINPFEPPLPDIVKDPNDPTSWDMTMSHTYTQPGVYYGTVEVSDWGGGTDTASFIVRVTGQQTISFPAVPDQTYGATLNPQATGSSSGVALTYTASPSTVCTANGANGTTVKLLGVGQCTITAHQGQNPPLFLAADPVSQTFAVDPAPLKITADDQTRVYGAAEPTLTATYDGLVNGDTPTAIHGLVLTGPPSTAHVGSYPITASNALNNHYAISYVDGTEKVTPAALTITPEDTAVAYGQTPTFSWTGAGWVNGDGAATLLGAPHQAPTCSAAVGGSPVSTTTPPGNYPDAISCSGAVDADYDISYGTADLRIDPRLDLAQQGLPVALAKVTVDQTSLPLPASRRIVYGSTHSYAFPSVVVDASGTTYVTAAAPFSGPITGNTSVTATYSTMAQKLQQLRTTTGLTSKESDVLTKSWNVVQSGLTDRKASKAIDALHKFATTVRKDSGKALPPAAATTLLTYAQAVYAYAGGSGSV